MDSAEEAVENAKQALNETKLYAPVSGTIVSLSGLTAGDAVSAGSTTSAATGNTGASSTQSATGTAGGAAGTTAGGLGAAGSTSSTSSSTSGGSSSPFAEIVNTHTMTVTVPFSESDVSKIKVGLPATVTLNALTGVELGARVTAISPVGSTSNGVVSYNATLTLDQGNSQVKAGMSASVAVVVGQAQGINLPNDAISGTGSLASVTVLDNGKRTKRQVVVGLRGDSRTQVVSGLKAGEQVVVTTVLPPLTSASTSSGSGSGGAGGTLGGTGRAGGFGGAGGAGGAGGFGGGGFGGGGGFRGGAAGGGA